MTAADTRKLTYKSFEMCCYQRIIKVCWRDKITNDSISDKVQRNFTVGGITKQRKLQLFGHICRMRDKRLIKIIMLGMVDGDRHRDRPPRRWVDDIVDWCGRPLPEVVWLTADREEWKWVVTGLNGSQGPWVKKKNVLCRCRRSWASEWVVPYCTAAQISVFSGLHRRRNFKTKLVTHCSK